MSLDIRTFRNTDASALCAVYASHYQAASLPGTLSPLSLELCVLSKPFFSPAQLLVAEQDEQVVGFLLIGFEPEIDLLAASSTHACISALCVTNVANEDEIAGRLLASAWQFANQIGVAQLRFSPPPPASPFMAGIAPGDGMIGAPDVDIRQNRWLQANNWEAGERVVCWEIDLGQFHPPMDRMQIQIRRMAHVDRLLDEPTMPWFIANMLGHAEQVGFQLTARETRTVAADVVLWTVGDELIPQSEMVARLWPLDPEGSSKNEDHYVFLLSEAFRQLREDRVDVVRTVSSHQDAVMAHLLQRVGFRPHLNGTVFSLQIKA